MRCRHPEALDGLSLVDNLTSLLLQEGAGVRCRLADHVADPLWPSSCGEGRCYSLTAAAVQTPRLFVVGPAARRAAFSGHEPTGRPRS